MISDILSWPDVPANVSEDCLNLNVFTPSSGVGNLPVMLFFHGGSFAEGSNQVHSKTEWCHIALRESARKREGRERKRERYF